MEAYSSVYPLWARIISAASTPQHKTGTVCQQSQNKECWGDKVVAKKNTALHTGEKCGSKIAGATSYCLPQRQRLEPSSIMGPFLE